MHINKLKLINFRNYETAQLEFSPRTNILYGNNAQGKTNILEAVYLFSRGKSYRTKTDKELVRFGADYAALMVEFEDAERKYSGKMQIMSNGRKAVQVNHVNISKLSQLMSYLNVVIFSPEDLDIVKGSPNVRRRFLDGAISQMYPSYLSALMEYNKVINQKSSLLKSLKYSDDKSKDTLSVWNEQLARSAVKIINARIAFTEQIAKWAEQIQNEISGEKLEIIYLGNVKTDDLSVEGVAKFFNDRSDREIDCGAPMYGIQRDDLEIHVNNRDSKLFASQGQQRTAALSMKIAQSEYINQTKGEYPILLLDDIMSELDISRRMYLSENIKDKQVLITSTDTDLIDKNTDTLLFKIDKGTVLRKG